MRRIAITTSDNPYNPVTDFDRWWNYDRQKNYATCELLDRISVTSDRVSDAQNEFEMERAIDFIVEMHPDLYKKVIVNL